MFTALKRFPPGMLIILVLLFLIIPIVIYASRNPSWKTEENESTKNN